MVKVEGEEVLQDPLANLDSEETVTPDPAKEEDNSTKDDEVEEKVKAKTEEKVEAKKEPTAKEIRHAQQQEWSKQEVDRLKWLVIDREVKDASQDITSLLDLHGKDSKLAKEVADKFDWTETSRWDYDSFLESKWIKAEAPVYVSDEEIEKRVDARIAQKEHDAAITEVEALISKLPAESQEEVTNEFNDLVEGKQLTKAKALKIANMVTLFLWKGKTTPGNTTEALKKLSTTTVSTAKKPADDWLVEVIVDGKVVLLDSNKLK